MTGNTHTKSSPEDGFVFHDGSARMTDRILGVVVRIARQSASPYQASSKHGKPSLSHMIHRLLCLLLVSLMLANQGLCLAHSHHGTDVADPAGHASLPHFHVGDHDHHDSTPSHDQQSDPSHDNPSDRNRPSDEHNATLPTTRAPNGDHDADAVYYAETVIFARAGYSTSDFLAKNVALAAIFQMASQGNEALRVGPICGQLPSIFEAACPIYLRTLSLRI